MRRFALMAERKSLYFAPKSENHAYSSFSVITDKVNGGGRGLNVVLFNATSKEVTGVGRFDTYEGKSSELFYETCPCKHHCLFQIALCSRHSSTRSKRAKSSLWSPRTKLPNSYHRLRNTNSTSLVVR